MSRETANKEQAVKVLYAELKKLGQNGEFEKAIKTANRSECSTSSDMFGQWLRLVPNQFISLQFWA